MKLERLLATTATAALLAMTAGNAFAQALEEITVTARRQEENLMQVPVAITAVTASAIEDRGLRDIQSLSEITPGMFSQVGGNGRVDRSTRRLTFRGLSVLSGAVFIDGMPYAGNGAPDVTDVERVEVLKGPQSVYFGRTTFSGAVNYVLKEPSDTFKGRIAIDAYSYGGWDLQASVSAPLGEKLAFRFNARKFSFGGQYANGGNTNDKLGKQKTNSFSVMLVAKPTDALKVNAFYSFTHDDDGAPPTAALKVAGTGPILNCNLGGTGGAWWCGGLPSADAIDPRNISVYNTMDAFTRRELINNVRGYPYDFAGDWLQHWGIKRYTHNSHLKLAYETEGGWSLNSMSSFNYTKYAAIIDQEYRDASNIPNPFYPATPALLAAACAAPAGTPASQPCFTQPFHQLTLLNQNLTTDWSQELRVSSPQDARLRATLGGSVFNSSAPGGVNMGFQASGRLTQAKTKTRTLTPAIFGGVYYDVTDRITLSGEARYQWDHIRSQQLFPAFGPLLTGTFPSFSPRATIDYKYAANSTAYATFSRGYRPGGFNGTILGLDPFIVSQLSTLGSNLTYKQEKLDNFELGHKGLWLDGRLRTTTAIYYDMWRDGQVSNTLFFTRPDGSTGSATVTQNIGQVNMKGIEFESEIQLTEHLNISATLDYQHTKVLSYVFSPDGLKIRNSTNVTGNQMEQAPAWTWSISPQYSAPLVGDWSFFARIDYRHRSKIFFDPTNTGWLNARDLVNARVGVKRDNLRIEAYVNNLTNNKNLTEAVRGNDTLYGVNGACPPCYTAALPPTTRGGSVLNELRVGLPVKQTFGLRATYDF